MLVAVFVEFLHVDPPLGSAYAIAGSDVLTTAQPVRPLTDPYACPACAWLRLGPRQASHIGLNLVRDTVAVLVVPPVGEWPDSPTPRPSAFRGPPTLA
jgi:hypothetical protein